MNSSRDFELLAVTIQVDGHPDIPVPLAQDGPDDQARERWARPTTVSLREGAEFRVRLDFSVRARHDVDGLKFIDERTREGVTMGHRETHLGDYRPGGPYEVVLPPEHLPTGHLARCTYECTGTFVDGAGQELGRVTHALEITKDWPQ
ncbi:rho GDP-dissociation inhibitor [Streptomyces formicae]|uniref:Uncharacterized protein n=1 Tax=Streptomyces formicae TaxID=1616117 RepID=A0ABY3WLX5_9ACTN|nr:rho GDP-dissociation inhibitor [Streptomyces formicae]UNM12660.1 hypothetical protein J4032_15030 [Streptomyces formicae]